MLARPVPPPPLCCGWRAPSRLSRGLACPASAGGGSEPPSVAAEKGKDADKKKKKKKKSAADGGSGGKKAAASASPATGAAPPNFPSLSLRGASSAIPSGDMYLDVDVFLTEDAEAEPQPAWAADAKRVAASLEAAAPALLAAVLAAPHPPPALRAVTDAAKGCELSVALCSDAYIASLNASWRSVDGPTDVLSFPQMTSEDGGPGVGEGGVGGEAEGEGNGGAPSASSSFLLPGGHALLGDIVISVETAARQAAARGASVEQEAQVLLVHGLLHLFGYDHEAGDAAEAAMKAEENRVLEAMGWGGASSQGLIENAAAAVAAAVAQGTGSELDVAAAAAALTSAVSAVANAAGAAGGGLAAAVLSPPSAAAGVASPITLLAPAPPPAAMVPQTVPQAVPPPSHPPRGGAKGVTRRVDASPDVLLLDMDGTLLNTSGVVSAGVAAAVTALLSRGVGVYVATGKARPGAASALAPSPLAGLAGPHRPGVYLNGGQVFGRGGSHAGSTQLPDAVVADAFALASESGGVPIIAYAGDTCRATEASPQADLLADKYHEPRAEVVASLDALLSRSLPPVLKVLIYGRSVGEIDAIKLKAVALFAGRAVLCQAQADMLEVLPLGISKGAGARQLLLSIGVDPKRAAAVGDGDNDVEMLSMVGTGIAMANAMPTARQAAAHVLSRSNNEDGVVEAIHRFFRL